MSWTVVLENEDSSIVAVISQEFDADISKFNDNFRLLKNLDPFSDTIFNRLQMDDLIYDLNILLQTNKSNIIAETIELAQRCKVESHTFLAFYGD